MKKSKYPLIVPYIGEKELKAVTKVLQSGWLTHGEYAEKLQRRIASYSKTRYAFILNSATSGLIAGLRALGLKKNDEVIVPSFTFPATANSVILAGAKPVFCDIGLDTFNIAPSKIEALISKRTKAIMPVHQFGLSVDMKKLLGIANRHSLSIIEDAACSLGAEYNGKKTGTLGNIGVFSFHPRKIITSGEGGCLITRSSKIAKKIEYLRNHGESNKKFIGCGYNFRLSDIQAAMLFFQFEKMEEMLKRRIKLALNYSRILKPLEDKKQLKIPACPIGFRHIYQSYVILLSEGINRDNVKRLLNAKGIETQFGTYSIPQLDYYRKNFKIPKESYRNSDYAYKHTLTLPLYHTLKYTEQEYIQKQLIGAIRKCAV
jgi:dTDP-4-amino-4,6-dideoxygalactose transaminase